MRGHIESCAAICVHAKRNVCWSKKAPWALAPHTEQKAKVAIKCQAFGYLLALSFESATHFPLKTANTTADSSTKIFAMKSPTTAEEILPAENEAKNTAEHAAEKSTVNVSYIIFNKLVLIQ